MSEFYTDEDVRRLVVSRHSSCERGRNADRANWCVPHNAYWPSGQSACNAFVDLLDDAEALLDAAAPAIAVRALREAADDMSRRGGITVPDKVPPDVWLRYRADEIANGRI